MWSKQTFYNKNKQISFDENRKNAINQVKQQELERENRKEALFIRTYQSLSSEQKKSFINFQNKASELIQKHIK
jgi:hypothetical protein